MEMGISLQMPAACMTQETISAYLQQEKDRGVAERSLRNYRLITGSLYEWLPEDKLLTKERLRAWRQSLQDRGYSAGTERNYIKGINRYLAFIGHPELGFPRGRARDLAGQQFGYLTAIEPTGEKNRRDIVWRCVCRCGKEVTCPATRLLLGNTVSCGCLRGDYLRESNKYIAGTSLRQSLEERVYSTRAASGYTGVTAKRGKWNASIRYKGRNISLGSYTELEEAVKARARGKELVRLDALGLLDFYEALHREEPARPDRAGIREASRLPAKSPPPTKGSGPCRSNNTSGCPGVYRRRNKWAARITWKGVTYSLGVYGTIDGAVAARREAENLLAADPGKFLEKYRKPKETEL